MWAYGRAIYWLFSCLLGCFTCVHMGLGICGDNIDNVHNFNLIGFIILSVWDVKHLEAGELPL